MSERLVIRLGESELAPVHWLVWSDSEDDIIASGELPNAAALSTLAERAGGRPVTALVPGSDVVLKQVTLPSKGGRKALAALPFMLEEELAADIDSQFFALGSKQGQIQHVAIVAHSKMQSWLAWIAEAGLACDRLLPDILALPWDEDQWSVLCLGEQLIVRQGDWLGLQGEAAWMLPVLMTAAEQVPDSPVLATFSQEPLPGLENLDIQQQPLEVPMQLLAKGAAASGFNLLQGDYKVKIKASGPSRQWLLAAALAGIALLSSLIDKGIEWVQLDNQQTNLQEATIASFKQAFPETRRIVNVRAQMRQKMAELEQGGGGVSMLTMMTQLSPAFASSQVKPQSLRFDGKRSELRLQAVAANFEALESFKRQAEQAGFEVQQGAINNRDDKVVGSLAIRS